MITLVKTGGKKFMVIDTPEKMRIRKAELEAEDKAEQAKLEEAKKNRNFVQVYRDNMPELRWLMAKSGIASSLLFFIMEHMDNKNALACSYAVFQDYFKVSKPTITRAISLLKDNGFIDILKMGTSNVYIINYAIAWSSWSNQKQFAKFDGTILVSKKENKDYEYRSQFDKFKALRQRENIQD
jgi:DNA-binding transcriptional ArsR family regulator